MSFLRYQQLRLVTVLVLVMLAQVPLSESVRRPFGLVARPAVSRLGLAWWTGLQLGSLASAILESIRAQSVLGFRVQVWYISNAQITSGTLQTASERQLHRIVGVILILGFMSNVIWFISHN